MSLNLDRHDAGSEINAADLNDHADALEGLLNGPGASPAGTGLADANFAGNFPAVTVQSMGAANPVRAGKMILLRAGVEVIPFVYDTALGKWVSDPFPAIQQQQEALDSDVEAAYVDMSESIWPRLIIPNFKALYAAGVRPQVFVTALLDNTGANDTFLRAAIRDFDDGDAAASAERLTGGEVVNNGTTGRYQVADWATMTGTAPTQAHGLLVAQRKQLAGTASIQHASIWLRWVSA